MLPWSGSCWASVEHLANVDWLVSMVFEVLQSVGKSGWAEKIKRRVFVATFLFWVILTWGRVVKLPPMSLNQDSRSVTCVVSGLLGKTKLNRKHIFLWFSIAILLCAAHSRLYQHMSQSYHARIGLLVFELDWKQLYKHVDKLDLYGSGNCLNSLLFWPSFVLFLFSQNLKLCHFLALAAKCLLAAHHHHVVILSS